MRMLGSFFNFSTVAGVNVAAAADLPSPRLSEAWRQGSITRYPYSPISAESADRAVSKCGFTKIRLKSGR